MPKNVPSLPFNRLHGGLYSGISLDNDGDYNNDNDNENKIVNIIDNIL